MSQTQQEIVQGIHYKTGAKIEMEVKDGRILRLQEHGLDPLNDLNLPLIGPGLVDLQINGYLGDDMNTLPLVEDTVVRLVNNLMRVGVTALYPTVITNRVEAIEEAVKTIADACDHNPSVNAAIPGIHLEGPFISPQDGARGAHDLAFVRAPDWDIFSRWQRAAKGRIKILTLSPEWEGTPDFIRRCVESGVTVSIGHTSASPEQIREAVCAGASMSTHLGNGAHGTLPRHPNYIWEQLAEDGLWAGVIADGFHLPASVLKVALRTKGSRIGIVSDAVYLSGMKPGDYRTHIGGSVTLQPNGRLCLTDNPSLLAGSALPITRGIEYMVESELCTWDEVWDLASVRPSEAMGLETAAGLEEGAPADFVLFSVEAGKLRIHETVKQGIKVYQEQQA